VLLGVYLLGPEVAFRMTGRSLGATELWTVAATIAVAGLSPLLLAWALAAALWRRRPGRLAFLALLWLVSCVGLGAVLLYLDAPSLDDEQRYTLDGWHRLWVPGLFVAGALLLVSRVLRGLWRGLRGNRRRKARPGPAAAA
jgi:hypothetical protein